MDIISICKKTQYFGVLSQKTSISRLAKFRNPEVRTDDWFYERA